MPDIVAEIINGGHDFKTSLMAGFETRLNESGKPAMHRGVPSVSIETKSGMESGRLQHHDIEGETGRKEL